MPREPGASIGCTHKGPRGGSFFLNPQTGKRTYNCNVTQDVYRHLPVHKGQRKKRKDAQFCTDMGPTGKQYRLTPSGRKTYSCRDNSLFVPKHVRKTRKDKGIAKKKLNKAIDMGHITTKRK